MLIAVCNFIVWMRAVSEITFENNTYTLPQIAFQMIVAQLRRYGHGYIFTRESCNYLAATCLIRETLIDPSTLMLITRLEYVYRRVRYNVITHRPMMIAEENILQYALLFLEINRIPHGLIAFS